MEARLEVWGTGGCVGNEYSGLILGGGAQGDGSAFFWSLSFGGIRHH